MSPTPTHEHSGQPREVLVAWFVDLLHLSPRCLAQSVEPGSLPKAHTRYKGRSDNNREGCYDRYVCWSGRSGLKAEEISQMFMRWNLNSNHLWGGGLSTVGGAWVMHGVEPWWRGSCLALASIGSCLHAPSSAHSHQAMTQHESCHQAHRLHLGLTQCPEPKGTTPLSYINHTVCSISGWQQKTNQKHWEINKWLIHRSKKLKYWTAHTDNLTDNQAT